MKLWGNTYIYTVLLSWRLIRRWTGAAGISIFSRKLEPELTFFSDSEVSNIRIVSQKTLHCQKQTIPEFVV
jgi:hypothetical protein